MRRPKPDAEVPEPEAAQDAADAPLSKTRRKQQMHALQALGERLVELRPDELDSLALPETLADAIAAARGIRSHEGRRRQMQYIGRLMREVDAAPIVARLDARSRVSRVAVDRMHAVERWRERLLAGDAAMDELLREHPHADTAALGELVRKARREHGQAAPPHAYRALFRALASLLDK